MSEETTETVVSTEPQDEPKGMRATIEKQSSRIKELESENSDQKQQIMSEHYAALNLDPNEQLGKAIAKEYDGEVSLEALAAFAKEEYNYEYTPVEGQNPQAQQIAQGQAALDQVGQTAGSIAAISEGDALAKAEADGDYATTLNIKGQQMANMLKP